MTIKDLMENYKGDLEVVVKQLSEDEAVEVVSFNASEVDAIKDEILNAEISKWFVSAVNKIPTYAVMTVLLKAVVTADPVEPSGPSGGTTTPDDSSNPTP